jgi:hypothetical protein
VTRGAVCLRGYICQFIIAGSSLIALIGSSHLPTFLWTVNQVMIENVDETGRFDDPGAIAFLAAR